MGIVFSVKKYLFNEYMEPDYILVVPSHKRVNVFRDKTYALLKRTNAIKPILWVKDEDDMKEYSLAFPELEIKTGGFDIASTRNAIQDYFPLNSKIVMIDDDIKNVFIYQKDKKVHKLRDFNTLVFECFRLAKDNDVTFWGTYPIGNPLCMKSSLRLNPCYINGSLFGVVNSRVSVFQNFAEDYERTIKYFLKEQKVLRMEWIGLETRYYKEKGGLQETRTEEKNRESKEKLVLEFPEHLKLVMKRGRAEISFKNSKKYLVDYDIPDDL